jgi:hypothetical protein
MFLFGAGALFGIPLTNAAGTAIATPSPVQFGILQEVQVDEEFEMKKLYGANSFPVAVGRGKGSVTLKAKAANFSAELYNTFFYGQTLTPGYFALYQDLTGTGATASITVDPPGSGVFGYDLGVQGSNGVPFTRVTGTPTGGQYSVNTTGGYVFSSQDAAAGTKVFINYEYTDASSPSTAQKLTVVNLPMGYNPTFEVNLMGFYNGKTFTVRYPNAVSGKIGRMFKNDDFTIPDLEIECFADANGNISYQCFYE